MGATGRFGKAIAEQVLSNPSFSLVAALTHSHSLHLGKDFSLLLNRAPMGLLIASELKVEVDLLIDVSLTAGFASHLRFALDLKKPFVSGTTGLSEKEVHFLKEAARVIPIFHAPNFSLGMALMRQAAQEIAKRFHRNVHIDLIETHHSKKKDIPSGSALLLAKAIEGVDPQAPAVRIHSLRSGEIIGSHSLCFNTTEEKLTLSHDVHSRDAFARGALLAAAFLALKPPGLYNMDDLLQSSRPQ